METPEKKASAKRVVGAVKEITLTIPAHMFEYMEELARAGSALGASGTAVADSILLLEIKRMMDSGYHERRWR